MEKNCHGFKKFKSDKSNSFLIFFFSVFVRNTFLLICMCIMIYMTIISYFILFSVFASANDTSMLHPKGITSSGLNTSISQIDNTYFISGGKKQNNNLYFSFESFSIHKDETAIFSDEGIKNTIGRVTGNNYSWINGTLQSYAENLFLLNPNGIMIGSNARLDIRGSLHLSTSDYLRMGEHDTFYAKPVSTELLSSCEPSAFGFIDSNVAAITFLANTNEQTIKNNDVKGLQVLPEKSISIIGGDIELLGNKDYSLIAPEGHIILASVASPGEIILNKSDLNITDFQKMGNITMSDNTSFILDSLFDKKNNQSAIRTPVGKNEASNSAAIVIRAENFKASHSLIKGITKHKTVNIDIHVNECLELIESEIVTIAFDFKINDVGKVSIKASHIFLTQGSSIVSDTGGAGNGGHINLDADQSIIFSGSNRLGYPSYISTSTTSMKDNAGNAGSISIKANAISFLDGGGLEAKTMGKGDGGTINLLAIDFINFDGGNRHGENFFGFGSGINSISGSDQSGNSGNIIIKSKKLNITNGALITSSTFGIGTGGIIEINVDESVYIGGNGIQSIDKPPLQSQLHFQDYHNTFEKQYISGIYSQTESISNIAGNAGKINITTSALSLHHKGIVTTSSKGKGKAGDIDIQVTDIFMSKESSISSESNALLDGGDAGTISIKANNSIVLKNRSSITTEAISAGGGNILIDATDLIYLLGSDITTSVERGEKAAGNIYINSGSTCLNHSSIVANADKGHGGNIEIISDQFIQSVDSTIDASSNLGIDGTVSIFSPDEKVSSKIPGLSTNFLNSSKWIKTPCKNRSGENISQLIIKGRNGIPLALDDLQPDPPIPFDIKIIEQLYDSKNDQQLFVKANIAYKDGQFVTIIHVLNDLLPKINKNSELYFQTLLYLSKAWQMIGHHDKALSILESIVLNSLDLDNYYKCLFLCSIADVYLSTGKHEKANIHVNDAKKIALQANNSLLLSIVMNMSGNYYTVKESYHDALSSYQNALDYLVKIEQGISSHYCMNLKSKILINFCRVILKSYVHYRMKSMYDCVSAVDITYSHINSLEQNYSKTRDLISLGLICLELEKHFHSKNRVSRYKHLLSHVETIKNDVFYKAQRISEELNDTKIASIACGYLGKLLEKDKKIKKAIKFTEKAIQYAQKCFMPEMLYLWYWQSGRLYLKTDHIEKSIKQYTHAINLLMPHKSSVENFCPAGIFHELYIGYRLEKKIFSMYIQPVFLELIEILIDQAMPIKDKKIKQQKLQSLIATIERMKAIELQDYFQDECLTDIPEQSTIFQQKHSNTAIVYPILLSNSITTLVKVPHEIQLFKISTSSRKVKQMSICFVQSIRDRSLINKKASYACDLYDLLIKPIDNELFKNTIKTLIIIPDDILRTIPYSALINRNTEKYLIQQYSLTVVPSYQLSKTSQTKTILTNNLLCGLSTAASGFNALTCVNIELEKINEIIGGRIIKNDDFTIENLKHELNNNDYNMIHFSTHGQVKKNSLESFILLNNGKLTMDHLEQLLHLGIYRQKPVELIVLSACETAIGDERAALGLAGIALKAGVKTALATLWPVEEKSTALAMIEFYKQLSIYNTTMTKAEALQSMQIKMLSGDLEKEFIHPYFWSPFLLIGNYK